MRRRRTMVDRQQAQQIAGSTAGALLLEEYEVEVADQPEQWVITYIPRARVRGGGFQLFVSKSTGDVSQVVRFQ
jgi:hypothetical protein